MPTKTSDMTAAENKWRDMLTNLKVAVEELTSMVSDKKLLGHLNGFKRSLERGHAADITNLFVTTKRNSEMKKQSGDFMQPVVEEGDWVMLDGPNGGECIPADVVDLDEVRDLMKRMEEGEKKISLEGTGLRDYTQNREIYDLDIKHGFGAHFSAPGYMDQTEWTVFDTEKEAVEFLKEENEGYEDEDEETENQW